MPSAKHAPGRARAPQNPGVRRGKITGAAEGFVALLASQLEALLSTLRATLLAAGAGKAEVEEEEGGLPGCAWLLARAALAHVSPLPRHPPVTPSSSP